MNLPQILDIAIGLLFIYLILSLLASEIQELLATLVQWRAKHLKNSIESLLVGGGESAEKELSKARIIANELYNDPLINTLNQEARGPLVTWFRNLAKFGGSLWFKMYCWMQKKEEVNQRIFGHKDSGPSYIQAETFATTLFKTIGIQKLLQKASGVSLEKFSLELIEDIKSIVHSFPEPDLSDEIKSHLERELNLVETGFKRIVQDLKNNKATLNTSLSRLEGTLNIYLDHVRYFLPENSELLRRISSLSIQTFNSTNKAVLLRSLQRSVTEVLADYKILKKALAEPNSESYRKIAEIYGSVENLVEEKILKNLPDSLVETISVIAKRTQIKIEDVDKELQHFQKEIETWFDRSMDRASGVYKRNAKGVAILIGMLVATATNADTFHIVSRLSKDSALRTTITERAIRTRQGDDINNVKQALENVSLPIGWSEANLQQQAKESQEWRINKWSFSYLKRLVGWILSAIAIAMGAPFWFDMLGKFINVRNAGPKPVSHTQERPPES
ncbi:hypothetical protein [Microseira wollei]|uniref:Uncharacterized protein n=1 Tax=Microseira wollei NIES-4236 TaxID=2530354 RepID=A0AAV3X888_9CYAN|nr:hypothetical protein [Microseira wollei]GET36851.1 hypothetical protein MiSe_16030 [Microseira wollei NIES-4236]